MAQKDLPDNYPWLPGSTRYPLADLGELAARLGSPVTYDRRGEVVWYDIFENSLSPWNTSALGTGAVVEAVTTDTDLEGKAAKLTGGSDGVRTATLTRRFSLTSLQKVGFEVSVYYTTTGFEHILLDVARYDSVNLHWGAIRILGTNSQEYLDSDNNYTEFATETVWGSTAPIYHNLKLVVDMDNDEYVRFLYDETEYDLSSIAIRSQASAVEPQHVIQFTVKSADGQNDIVQVGRAIVTGNEP